GRRGGPVAQRPGRQPARRASVRWVWLALVSAPAWLALGACGDPGGARVGEDVELARGHPTDRLQARGARVGSRAGARVELPAADGVLVRECGADRVEAVSGIDPEILKSHALSLLRTATEEGDDAVARTLVGALAADGAGEVERALVQVLCDRPLYREQLARAGGAAGEAHGRGDLPRRAKGPEGARASESARASEGVHGSERRVGRHTGRGDAEPVELVLPLVHPGPGGYSGRAAQSGPGEAPRVEGRSTRPDTFRLAEYRGRRVYLTVFGSWCPGCREEYPEVARLAERFRSAGEGAPVVVGLLLKDSPDRAMAFFAERGGPAYPLAALDRSAEVALGITGAPMGFLVGPDGRIEGRCYGCQRGPLAAEALEALVPTEPAGGG
ncbi:MAG TPA: TlpA disulfide reductase family protein, partial [Longimicrobiales bacterium]|nr:TlpA disulfide reductase family protein [Longimicrobiales bacterium]